MDHQGHQREQDDAAFKHAVETLTIVFGEILGPDILKSVAEKYSGDLNMAADAAMKIAEGINVYDQKANAESEAEQKYPNQIEQLSEESPDLVSTNVQQNDLEQTPSTSYASTVEQTPSTSYASTVEPIPSTSYASTVETIPSTSYASNVEPIPSTSYASTVEPTPSTSYASTVEQTPSTSYASTVEPTPSTSYASTVEQTPSTSYASTVEPTPSTSYASTVEPIPSTSYASTAAAKSTVALEENEQLTWSWSQELSDIVKNHKFGNRTLILMRGPPGSGKTKLARHVIDMCIEADPIYYKRHIFSTDDFFYSGGAYVFNANKLSQAHEWNQRRAEIALKQGLSPVIIDNTNIEKWEMRPYVQAAVNNGYMIEVLVPKTPWANNASLLAKKNMHQVSIDTIKKILKNFRPCTSSDLMKILKLTYSAKMHPPVRRVVPPVDQSLIDAEIYRNRQHIHPGVVVNSNDKNNNIDTGDKGIFSEIPETTQTQTDKRLDKSKEGEDEWYWDEFAGENVDDEWMQDVAGCIVKNEMSATSIECYNEGNIETKPKPTKSDSQNWPQKDTLGSLSQCGDWRQSLCMAPLHNDSHNKPNDIKKPFTKTSNASTCVEIGDTDLKKLKPNFRMLIGKPKDINLYTIPANKKPSSILMFDKSTSTANFKAGAYHCPHREQHFAYLRKLFKKIPPADLREIFDKCYGDVNWAVDLILDTAPSNQLEMCEDESDSDSGDIIIENCKCLAAYNIIPSYDVDETVMTNKDVSPKKTNNDPTTPLQKPAKKKPKFGSSKNDLELKRRIEQNIFIPDDYYSVPLLRERNKRHSEINMMIEGKNDQSDMHNIARALPLCLEPKPTILSNNGLVVGEKETTNIQKIEEVPSTSSFHPNGTDSDDDLSNGFEGTESMVTIKLDWVVIQQLQNTFGCGDLSTPPHVEPIVGLPLTLLFEINAYWIESVTNQLENHDKLNAQLLKEDEEFARQIEREEKEMYVQDREPKVPSFKEIMQWDLAMRLKQKKIDKEWNDKNPDSLAAKMTREKLYGLFPDFKKDVLTEFLVAHGHDFNATVESILMSTGMNGVLEEKDGLNNFLVRREIEVQQKILKEKEREMEGDAQPLMPPDETVDMASFKKHRLLAEQHLDARKACIERAKNYMDRTMMLVAGYYSNVARFHTKQYEHESILAANILMQVQASRSPNNPTIDLHFLRVAEAMHALDMFLDMHIEKLKESEARNQGHRIKKLFIITGRGAQSQFGVAKIKPAARRRLRERGLIVRECNPGMLSAQVTANDKLSHEMTAP